MISCIARGALALAVVLGASPTLAETAAGGGGIGFDLTVHGGLDKYDSVGLRSGLSSTNFSDSDRLRNWSQSYGLTAILRLGMLDVGALAEMGRPGKPNSTTAVGGLVGVNLIMDRLQLDALGEVGGHRYGDALHNTNVITDSNRSDWLMYVGLRPGIAVRLGEGGNILLGLWAFARWDVTSKDIPVTFADGSGSGTYKLGGTQFGAALRLGFSL
jgi:hypothetical protein